MSELLVPLCDPELGVRRVALVAFNSAAHNKPSLIRDLLPQVLPTIYSETKVKVSWEAITKFKQRAFYCHADCGSNSVK